MSEKRGLSAGVAGTLVHCWSSSPVVEGGSHDTAYQTWYRNNSCNERLHLQQDMLELGGE